MSPNILAVVPARGGSKGFPGKNLAPFLGRPLVSHVREVIWQVPEITHSVCSTDSLEIAEASKLHDIHRPLHLAGDHVGDIEVLQHALQQSELDFEITFDFIVMLQPTAPLRKPHEVRECIHTMFDGRYDSVWTVSPVPLAHHPLKALCIDNGLRYMLPGAELVIARQQLKQTYMRNGHCYALTRDCLMKQGRLLGAYSGAVICRGEHVSIDVEADLRYAEACVRASMGA